MKKLFVCALAASMFTACSQDETISQQSPMQISFDGAFVNKASRAAEAADPSTTTEGEKGLKAFDVWAYMDNGTGLFLGQTTTGQDNIDGEDVTGSKGNFTYVNTAYWNAGHTYYFHALAPMDSENAKVTAPTAGDALGLSNVEFTNEAGTEDLLYSTYTRTIEKGADLKDDANTGTVNLTFSHLLSKVKFSFKNTYTNPNIHFEVYDIQMTAPKVGNINLNKADWAKNSKWELVGTDTDVTTLSFGTTDDIKQGMEQECETERLTIPATAEQKYLVTFKVKLYNGGVCVNEENPYNHDITLTGVDFEIGKAYDLYAELNANNIIDPDDKENPDSNSYPIVFDVQEVKEWDQATDEKVDDWLVTEGEVLTLITNATTNKTLNLEGDNILNGNGNTLSMLEGTKDYYDGKKHLIFMQTSGNATINNLTIDGNNASYDGYGIRGIFMTGEGTVTLDNVTIKNVTYTINDDAAKKTLQVIDSKFEGWTSFNADATFENVEFTKNAQNGYAQLRPYNTLVLKNCSFAEGFKVDAKFTTNGKQYHPTITFEKCTYNDTPVTEDVMKTFCAADGNDYSKVTVITE